MATIVKLLEVSLIRIGNEEYARTNKSFGLTTMHNRHVVVNGATAVFEFQGKSGKKHKISNGSSIGGDRAEVPGLARTTTL